MDFPPANGWCSTSCKWLSTSFTATNASSTASKIYGATRPEYIGKQRRDINWRCGRSYLDHPVLIESRDKCQRLRARLADKLPTIYLGDGEVAGVGLGGACGAVPGEPCGPGVGGGLASSSSTSKIRVALGPSSGLTDRSPYARFDGTNT
jgi:hypothetical protein